MLCCWLYIGGFVAIITLKVVSVFHIHSQRTFCWQGYIFFFLQPPDGLLVFYKACSIHTSFIYAVNNTIYTLLDLQ